MNNADIQFDGAELVLGGINTAETVQTDGNIYFNESYVLIGNLLKAKKIHVTYDLTIIGDVTADVIEANGNVFVSGNIKAKSIRCSQLHCDGKVNVGSIQCDEEIIAMNISTDKLQVQGTVFVSDTLNIDGLCETTRNVVAIEGISGQGKIEAENAIAGEYFDFDGDIETKVYEIATMEDIDSSTAASTVIHDTRTYSEKLESLLKDFAQDIIEQEEDKIIEEIEKCAEKQKVSFGELLYLFNEIDRISYLNELDNYRDYLLVKYADEVFPSEFKEYETISHVFTQLMNNADSEELEYSANSLIELMMSLKIITTLYGEVDNEYVDKVFAFIGLKYSFVNKLFER